MKNTDLIKIAQILKKYQKQTENLSIDSDELLVSIADDIADTIDDEDARGWFYEQAGFIRPENADENAIS